MNKWVKQLTRTFLATAFVFAGTLSATAVRTEAARVSNLTQVNSGTHSATISWTVTEERYRPNQGFEVLIGETYSSAAVVDHVSASTTSYTFNGLADGKRYYARVQPIGNSGYGSTSLETIPESVKNFRQKQWWYFIKVLDVEWDRIDTADSIEVKLYNSKNKLVATNNVSGSSTSTSFNKMKDEVYTVTIRASKNGNWTPVSSIRCFNQARIKSVKATNGKLTVKWGKVGGATGYNIWVSTNPKKGYKKVKTVKAKTTSFTLKKFNKKKINKKKPYYVIVETKKGKNTSGKLYYWSSKGSRFGYLQ